MAKEKDDQKPETDLTTDAIKQVAKAMGEEMLSVAIAMQKASQPATVKPRVSRRNEIGECGECGQFKNACNGEHQLVCVYPTRYPEFGQWFTGRRINGINYISNGPNHLISVPKVAAGEVLRAIQQFEDAERINITGRQKMHNSGDVGSPNPANIGWR